MNGVPTDSPLVSVITPYRDAKHHLADLVHCLQAQTYSNWECLLVDHHSCDDGPSFVKNLVAGDMHFRCLSVACEDESVGHIGPAIPRNLGLMFARGSLVCFLDVDDLWHKGKLKYQVQFHMSRALDVSVTGYCRWYSDKPHHLYKRCPPSALSPLGMHAGNPIPMLTVMLSRDLVEESRRVDGSLFECVPHEDYLLWLQLYARYPLLRFGCLPKYLAVHRRWGNNLTSNRYRMLEWTLLVYKNAGYSRFNRWVSILIWCCAQLRLLVLDGLKRTRCFDSPESIISAHR